jgi:pimeloyl-ACP methyl ester carboxylesterase
MKHLIQKTIIKSLGLYINSLSFVAPKKSLKLAYKLFSEPRKGKIKKIVPKTIQRSTKEEFSLDEHTIQTYHWSQSNIEKNNTTPNDEIIFLIHGWESNGSRWKKLLKHLEKTGKTVIAIDAPAHGLSSGKEFNVPMYASFINEVAQKYQPKHIIGHSVGGHAIAYYQKHYKHNLESIVLLGTPSDLKNILNNFINLLGLNQKVYGLLKQYTRDRFKIDVEEFSAAQLLENCQIKGIIAHDNQDDVVHITEGKKIASSWKNAQFIEISGFGHSMHDENLYKKITEFVK